MNNNEYRQLGFNFEHSFRQLPSCFYSETNPKPVSKPEYVVLNQALAKQLGLNLSTLDAQEIAQIFSGNKLLPNSKPIAQAYAGHQFGHFTMLGDGRAHLLAEHIAPDKKHVDIQLKGSGRSKFSRRGDGRAALAPMLREYLVSEAMHHLDIPTTRSLTVVTTGEVVLRETALPGAILTRIAASHIRVGTFEYAALRNNQHELQQLADYAIARHYPECINSESPYVDFFEAVMMRQIELIVQWQRVGFVHGVMNTDNMSICGETIDYGPCAFMDDYHPKRVFSSIDEMGRYAYSNQPKIAQWNLARFAESLLTLIAAERSLAIEQMQPILNTFEQIYHFKWHSMMAGKLGIAEFQAQDESLINDLLIWMQAYQVDFTNTFLQLADGSIKEQDFFQAERVKNWHKLWEERIKQQSKSHLDVMQAYNPQIIPRNHLLEQALQQANDGNLYAFEKLLKIVQKPYEKPEKKYQMPADKQTQEDYQTFCGT